MYDCENLKKKFNDRKCTLLSDQQDLEQGKKVPVVRFIASCGHENTVFVNVFLSRNTGVICKHCLSKSRKIEYPNLIKRELDFTYKFQDIISSAFISKTTNEGCLSDLIIKPVDVLEDKWLRVQIKTTQRDYCKSYGFTLRNKYENHLLICHCIYDRKYWIIPYNDLTQNKKINLCLSTKSKYFQYHAEYTNIIPLLMKYYHNTFLYGEDICMVAVSEQMQKEQKYRKKIYDNLSFLNIQQPKYTSLVYDLIIEEKKIQEKVLSLSHNKKGYGGIIGKRGGTRKMQNYTYQDNDFYWFHIHNTEFFYVIPQYELLLRDIISFFEVEGRKSVYFYTKDTDYKHSWANTYLFNYKNNNRGRLEKVLHTDYTELDNAVMYIKIMEMC